MSNTRLHCGLVTVGVLVILAVFPAVTHAQDATLSDLVNDGIGVAALMVAVMISLAIVLFAVGITKFVSRAENEQAVREGKPAIMWGIVAIFLIISVWSLALLLRTIFFGNDTSFGNYIMRFIPILPENESDDAVKLEDSYRDSFESSDRR